MIIYPVKNAQVTFFAEKPQIKINNFLKTRSSNSCFIRQSFQRTRCKWGNCNICMEGHLKLRVQSL